MRPFSLHQLRLIELGLAEPLTLATGLTLKELRWIGKHQPLLLPEIRQRIDALNAWDIKDIVRKMETEGEKLEGDDEWSKLFHAAPELVRAGHARESLWSLTLEQLAFWYAESRRINLRDRLFLKQDFTHAATVAVGTLTKEGTKIASELIKELGTTARNLDEAKS